MGFSSIVGRASDSLSTKRSWVESFMQNTGNTGNTDSVVKCVHIYKKLCKFIIMFSFAVDTAEYNIVVT